MIFGSSCPAWVGGAMPPPGIVRSQRRRTNLSSARPVKKKFEVQSAWLPLRHPL
jgi:hypothetical protein